MYKDVYVTGDTHGDFERVTDFVESLTEPSVIIIAGDFGGIWSIEPNTFKNYDGEKVKINLENENIKLDNLSQKLDKYLLLFCDGNHENFERLYKFPQEKLFGGMTHKIRNNIYHLMRGEVFNIADLKIFVFGGAYSHDISGGLIDIESDDYYRQLNRAYVTGLPYRIKRLSWWKEEKPSKEELEKGYKALEENKYFNYIITHQTNIPTEKKINIEYNGEFGYEFNDFLRAIDVMSEYKKWIFGHYHQDKVIDDKHIVIYREFLKLEKDGIKYV